MVMNGSLLDVWSIQLVCFFASYDFACYHVSLNLCYDKYILCFYLGTNTAMSSNAVIAYGNGATVLAAIDLMDGTGAALVMSFTIGVSVCWGGLVES